MLTRGLSLRSCRAHPKYGITAVIVFADARFAASIIKSSSMRLSEFGNVLCTRNTSLPRIDSSYDTANSPSAKWMITRLPRGHPRLAHIFSDRYLEFVPENTIKELFSLIVVLFIL